MIRTPPPHLHSSRRSSGSAGFSLVEVLVCLAIIAVMSSIAIAWFSNARRDLLERVANQRNAQEIVSMGVYATVAGADFVESGDKFNTVQNLLIGTTGTVGIWKDQTFRLTSLEPAGIPDALPFVRFEEGLLTYEPAGGQP